MGCILPRELRKIIGMNGIGPVTGVIICALYPWEKVHYKCKLLLLFKKKCFVKNLSIYFDETLTG